MLSVGGWRDGRARWQNGNQSEGKKPQQSKHCCRIFGLKNAPRLVAPNGLQQLFLTRQTALLLKRLLERAKPGISDAEILPASEQQHRVDVIISLPSGRL